MEQSKLISVIIANFKVAYPYYFTKLSDEEFLGLVGIYQECFGKFNGNALMRAVKKIFKKEKFMPTIADIIEVYKKEARYYFIELVNESNIDEEDKRYLTSMADWYSLQEEFPDEFMQRINELDSKKLSTSNNLQIENKSRSL